MLTGKSVTVKLNFQDEITDWSDTEKHGRVIVSQGIIQDNSLPAQDDIVWDKPRYAHNQCFSYNSVKEAETALAGLWGASMITES